MNKYIFHGLVIPERVNATITKSKCTFPDNGIEIILECYHSKIVAECSCDDVNLNLLTLKNNVEMAARIFIDVIGYTIACGYDIEIESAYNLETNQLQIFGVHEPIFDDPKLNESTSQGIPHPDIITPYNELVKTVGINTELVIALGDFREAIRQPNFTSFHCYRAVEALRHAFAGDETAQWEGLRNALKVDKADIYKIKSSADSLRHGKSSSQSWEVRKEHMLIASSIIKKYIDWRSTNPNNIKINSKE